MLIGVKTKNDSYNIHLERGILDKVGEIINIGCTKALIVTDSGVPTQYVKSVKNSLNNAFVFTFPQGEENKNFTTFCDICRTLLKEGFTRKDCVIALGGGVTGDMAGFAAACYMRGIDFYNIPTTLLSQVDSSIGGKTAVDLDGIKNIVGAFYQPKAVIIDPEVLKTLDKRQISNGIAESIKMGIVLDEKLFALCEDKNYLSNIDEIIYRSILAKKDVVQKDETESGLRKVLNFGHTIGHGIESASGLNGLLHGECVGLGIIPMCSDSIKDRVVSALKNCSLPTSYNYDKEKVYSAITHDKKASTNAITLVKCDKIGNFYFEDTKTEDLKNYL